MINSIKVTHLPLMILFTVILSTPAAHAEVVKHQVTGLFCVERVEDLRALFLEIPDIKLLDVDYKNAEATFEYDVKKAFGAAKPEQVVQRFDNLVRTASRGCFGIKAIRTAPREKLTFVEIAVAGLDCKACSLGAYEAIYKLDGVEQATASFREGRVTAWIDAARTNRETLEAALRKKGVHIK